MKTLIVIAALFCLFTKINGQSTANVCEGIANGIFVADISSCDAFFTCVDNVAHPGRCPPPYLFNEPGQTCDFEYNVECFTCPETGFSRMPVSGSCTRFIQCSGGAASTLECPPPLHFDPIISECNTATDCVPNPCPAVDQPSNPIFVPHPTDCQLYSVCENGELSERQCPPDTHWNQAGGTCDLPEVAQCPNAPEPTEPPLVSCPATGVHFLPHPTDCNLYFICSNGVPSQQECAPNKHWDIVNNRCDTQELATCGTATP